MKLIIARLKMNFIPCITLISILITCYLFCISPASPWNWVYPLLLFIEILYQTRHPRRLFQRRLNDYFVVTHYPLSHWNQIYQAPVKKAWFSKGKQKSCDELFHTLLHQMKSMFSPEYFPDGYYRTITHKSLISRILKCQNKGELTVLAIQKVNQERLEMTQHELTHKNCSRCCDAAQCHFKGLAHKPRPFYYIEFQVHYQHGFEQS